MQSLIHQQYMIGGNGNSFQLAGGAGASTGSAMVGGINNSIQGSSVSSFILGGENNILRRPYIGNGGNYNGIIGGDQIYRSVHLICNTWSCGMTK